MFADVLHPGHREDYDPKQTRNWAEGSEWQGLEIIATDAGGPEDTSGTVEFIAEYTTKGRRNRHHELASFEKQEDVWYFTDGAAVPPKQVVRTGPKIGRNDPCSCGSGKKYKKCCGK
ncbi:MAG: YchJ family metal-binding protein [Desulfobacterales bacterium]